VRAIENVDRRFIRFVRVPRFRSTASRESIATRERDLFAGTCFSILIGKQSFQADLVVVLDRRHGQRGAEFGGQFAFGLIAGFQKPIEGLRSTSKLHGEIRVSSRNS